MKFSLLWLLLPAALTALPSRASEMILVRNQTIYAVPEAPSFLNGARTQMDSSLFLELEKTGEEFSFARDTLVPLPPHRLLSRPEKPIVPELEGCAHYPIEWLPGSSLIGRLLAKNAGTKIFISLPKDAKIVSVPPNLWTFLAKEQTKEIGATPPLTEKNMKTYPTKVLSQGQDLIAFTLFDLGLNQQLLISVKKTKGSWKPARSLTLTDGCP